MKSHCAVKIVRAPFIHLIYGAQFTNLTSRAHTIRISCDYFNRDKKWQFKLKYALNNIYICFSIWVSRILCICEIDLNIFGWIGMGNDACTCATRCLRVAFENTTTQYPTATCRVFMHCTQICVTDRPKISNNNKFTATRTVKPRKTKTKTKKKKRSRVPKCGWTICCDNNSNNTERVVAIVANG